MIRHLSINNFKIHSNTTLELGRINVFIGPQGTGKSSVLEVLGLLMQSNGREGLSLDGPWVKDVRFEDIVNWDAADSPIRFVFDMPLEARPLPFDNHECHVSYEIRYDNQGFRDQNARFTFRHGSEEKVMTFKTSRGARWDVPEPLVNPGKPKISFSGSKLTLLPFMFRQDGQDYRLHRGWDDARKELNDYFANRVHFVPALRHLTQRSYARQSPSVLEKPDHVVSLLDSAWDRRDEMNNLLEQCTDRRINVRPVNGELHVEASNGRVHSILCEGLGVRQLVWPLTAIAYATPGSLVCIEEPEIHLHPESQSRLCGVFVHAVNEGDLTFLLTTHSEHILTGLLTAVAEKRIKADDLTVYFFGRGEAPSRLEVTSRGTIKGGLKGFTEASLNEMEEYLTAVKDQPSGS